MAKKSDRYVDNVTINEWCIIVKHLIDIEILIVSDDFYDELLNKISLLDIGIDYEMDEIECRMLTTENLSNIYQLKHIFITDEHINTINNIHYLLNDLKFQIKYDLLTSISLSDMYIKQQSAYDLLGIDTINFVDRLYSYPQLKNSRVSISNFVRQFENHIFDNFGINYVPQRTDFEYDLYGDNIQIYKPLSDYMFKDNFNFEKFKDSKLTDSYIELMSDINNILDIESDIQYGNLDDVIDELKTVLDTDNLIIIDNQIIEGEDDGDGYELACINQTIIDKIKPIIEKLTIYDLLDIINMTKNNHSYFEINILIQYIYSVISVLNITDSVIGDITIESNFFRFKSL